MKYRLTVEMEKGSSYVVATLYDMEQKKGNRFKFGFGCKEETGVDMQLDDCMERIKGAIARHIRKGVVHEFEPFTDFPHACRHCTSLKSHPIHNV